MLMYQYGRRRARQPAAPALAKVIPNGCMPSPRPPAMAEMPGGLSYDFAVDRTANTTTELR